MTKKEPSTIRAFLAVEINDQVRKALTDTVGTLKKAEARVSWVPSENVHVTMVFLGDIFPRMVEPICKGLDQVAAEVPPFSFEVGGLGFFGSPKRPRVIWAGLVETPEELLSLHRGATAVVNDIGIPTEKRAFKPHLTLGRVRGPRNLPALTSAITSANNTRHGSVDVCRLLFMQSRLEPDGAKYSILHESLLKGA